jgi:hypothetical protein
MEGIEGIHETLTGDVAIVLIGTTPFPLPPA